MASAKVTWTQPGQEWRRAGRRRRQASVVESFEVTVVAAVVTGCSLGQDWWDTSDRLRTNRPPDRRDFPRVPQPTQVRWIRRGDAPGRRRSAGDHPAATFCQLCSERCGTSVTSRAGLPRHRIQTRRRRVLGVGPHAPYYRKYSAL